MEATKTYRKNEGGGRTQVGAADIYEPRCLKHWVGRLVIYLICLLSISFFTTDGSAKCCYIA